MPHSRLHRVFLWIAVLAWGVGVGAKLFDLLILAGAWSAAPPQSLSLLPYGPRFPVDPGDFFIPVSLSILIGSIGALATGWRGPVQYRVWLSLSAILIFLVWLLTMTMMWRMNGALYAAASTSVGRDIPPTELVRLARRWIAYDWVRVAMMAAGFVSSVRAISLIAPRSVQ